MFILYLVLAIAIFIAVGFAFGFFTRYMFEIKGHSGDKGFWFGFFFGVIATIYAIGLPNLNPPEQIVVVKTEKLEQEYIEEK